MYYHKARGLTRAEGGFILKKKTRRVASVALYSVVGGAGKPTPPHLDPARVDLRFPTRARRQHQSTAGGSLPKAPRQPKGDEPTRAPTG